MNALDSPNKGTIRLCLHENLAQFSLLVLVNAFVGALVGLERSILPANAEQKFQLAARRDRRCRPPVVARIRGRRLSPLA